MLKHLSLLAVPAILLTSLAVAPAQAQVGIQIGPGGARVYEERPRVIVRERRRGFEDDRGYGRRGRDRDCEMVERTRVNRRGETVTTRSRVCN